MDRVRWDQLELTGAITTGENTMSITGGSSSIGGNDATSFKESLKGPGLDHPNCQIKPGKEYKFIPYEKRLECERADSISMHKIG